MPSSANGIVPTRSTSARPTQRPVGSAASVVATPTATTSAAAGTEKAAADRKSASRRAGTPTGSVRRYASHGDVRSTAIPTPNWKNATPIAANPAKAAILIVAYGPGDGATKKRKKTVGNSSVGTM